KWRPSAEAQRLGPVAVLLERLMYRDGYSFDEACRLLRTNYGVTLSDEELERLRALLPVRAPRRYQVDDQELANAATEHPNPEEETIRREQEEEQAHRQRALKKAMEGLEPRERLILQWFYFDHLTIAQIARALVQPDSPRRRYP